MITARFLTPMRLSGSELYGAAYDRDMRLIPESLRRSEHVSVRHRDPAVLFWHEATAATETADALFLGHHFEHHGHFLLETMPMLAHLLDRQEPAIFLDWMRTGRSYLDRFLTLAALNDRIAYINVYGGDVVLKAHFEIAPRPIVVGARILDKTLYESIISRVAAQLPEIVNPPRKVFLQRASNRVSREYSTFVENLLTERGFAIVRPEHFELAQQIAIVRNADVIVGFSGSQLHNSIFCRPKTQIIELGDERSPASVNTNQRCCAEVAGTPLHFIQFTNDTSIVRRLVVEAT